MHDDISPDLAAIRAANVPLPHMIHHHPVEPIVSPEAEEAKQVEQMAHLKRLQDKTKFRKAKFRLD